MKDKDGNEITLGQFASRWKDGINKVTPLQQVQVSVYGYFFILAGIIAGIIYAISGSFWWLTAILFGAFIINILGFIGTIQKLNLLKKQEEYIKELSRRDNNLESFKKYMG